MTFVTHTLGGAVAGMVLIQATNASEPIAMAYIAGGAVVGSLLPDIDHTRSKISNSNLATGIISRIVSIFFKHRGFLHTPVFIVILNATVYITAGMLVPGVPSSNIAMAISLGALSHLILDSLTPGGIMWFWPLSKRRINFLSIRTGGLAEKIFAGVFCAFIGWAVMG